MSIATKHPRPSLYLLPTLGPRLRIALILLATCSLGRTASADTLGSRASQRGVVTHVDKGLFQLGVDSTMQLAFTSSGGVSSSRSSADGNVMLRYLIKPKVGVSGRVGGFFRKVGDSADKGFAMSGWGNYFMRLGEGMFFVPGAGAGLVFGNRDVPLPTGAVSREKLFGISLNAELMATMFVSPRFSLNAGPNFSLLLANAGESSTEFSGAFKIGATYNY